MSDRAPRNVAALAATAILDMKVGTDVEQLVSKATWARSFLSSPAMADPTRRELFIFLVLSSALARADPAASLSILAAIRDRVFFDSEYHIPSLPFHDIDGVVERTFWLFHTGPGLTSHRTAAQLASNILSLQEDQTVRAALEPAYLAFLKTSSLHPLQPLHLSRILCHCSGQ